MDGNFTRRLFLFCAAYQLIHMLQQNNNTDFLRSISILFTAMLAGQIIFAALALVLVYTGNFSSSMPQAENIFFILVPALIISGRLAGTTLYKKKVQQARDAGTIAEKRSLYRAAFITRCALLEGPILFAIITYLLTNKTELLAFAAGGILLFYMLKPGKEKIANELQVSENELL